MQNLGRWDGGSCSEGLALEEWRKSPAGKWRGGDSLHSVLQHQGAAELGAAGPRGLRSGFFPGDETAPRLDLGEAAQPATRLKHLPAPLTRRLLFYGEGIWVVHFVRQIGKALKPSRLVENQPGC